MPINVGKNLKISPTNDTKVSRFVRDYSNISDYISSQYPDTSQNLILKDLLDVLIRKYTLSYSNLPAGATFVWTCNGQTLGNNVEVPVNSLVEYTLTFFDDSRYSNSFVVSDNFSLDLSTLEANQYLVTITSDKTLSYLGVDRYYGTSQQIHYTVQSFVNNTYTFYADKNEPIKLVPLCNDYTYDDKSLSNMGHPYNYTVTQNINCNAIFPYVAWKSYDIGLKDENDKVITNRSQYLYDLTVMYGRDNIRQFVKDENKMAEMISIRFKEEQARLGGIPGVGLYSYLFFCFEYSLQNYS